MNKTQKILFERTKLLAQKIREYKDSERVEVIQFILGKEQYAIEAKSIKAIQPKSKITHLPGLPEVILGITSLAGEIFTVLDLTKLLNIEHAKHDRQYIIFLNHSTVKISFLIDAIVDFKFIELKEIQQNIAGLKGIESGLIKGLLPGAIALLNPVKLLSFKIKA